MAIGIEKSTVFPDDSGLRSEEHFDRHRGPITSVAGIPGKNASVSGGYDAAVGIVDFDRGTIELLGYHQHLVNRVVVDATGTRAASCSSDYTIYLWDLEKREPVRVLHGHWDDVEDFAFVDAHTGISVSRDRRIFVWNLQTGAIIKTMEEHERDVLSVEYSNGLIYSSGDDMTLRQWSLETGKLLRTWGPLDEETDTCAIDAIHDRVMLGADDGKIRLFDSQTGDSVCEIDAHSAGIKKVAVSPINGDILSAAYDQRIRIWDAETFSLKRELENHPATWERSLNWAPDGKTILGGTFDGTVLRWDAVSGKQLVEIGKHPGFSGNACLNDVSASSDGIIAVVSDDGLVRTAQFTNDEAEWTQTIEPASGRILMNSVCVDDPSARVFAGAHDQKLHIFDRSGGSLTSGKIIELNEGPINCIRVTGRLAGGREAFVACYSGSIVRVSLDGEVLARHRLHPGAVKSVSIHPNKEHAVSGAADGSLLAWDLDGRLIASLHGHTAIVDDVDFDPSGERFASVSRDFTVNVYDYESSRLVHSILLGRQSPKCVLFWDPETVIVGNYWGQLWRVRLSDEQVTTHQVARNGISSVSRCGDLLIAASYDGGVYCLNPENMTVFSELRTMQQKLSRYRSAASIEQAVK